MKISTNYLISTQPLLIKLTNLLITNFLHGFLEFIISIQYTVYTR